MCWLLPVKPDRAPTNTRTSLRGMDDAAAHRLLDAAKARQWSKVPLGAELSRALYGARPLRASRVGGSL